jgi:hypothetical protein
VPLPTTLPRSPSPLEDEEEREEEEVEVEEKRRRMKGKTTFNGLIVENWPMGLLFTWVVK